MAIALGSFDKDVVSLAWFDETASVLGSFDRDLVDNPTAALDLTTVIPAIFQLMDSGGYIGQVYV